MAAGQPAGHLLFALGRPHPATRGCLAVPGVDNKAEFKVTNQDRVSLAEQGGGGHGKHLGSGSQASSLTFPLAGHQVKPSSRSAVIRRGTSHNVTKYHT